LPHALEKKGKRKLMGTCPDADEKADLGRGQISKELGQEQRGGRGSSNGRMNPRRGRKKNHKSFGGEKKYWQEKTKKGKGKREGKNFKIRWSPGVWVGEGTGLSFKKNKTKGGLPIEGGNNFTWDCGGEKETPARIMGRMTTRREV